MKKLLLLVGLSTLVFAEYFGGGGGSSTTITANRAAVSDGSGALTAATTTATEIGYVNGVTSAIQTQLNAKSPAASPTFSGTITTPLTASRALVTGASNELAASAVTTTELALLSGKTSVGDASGPGSSTDNAVCRFDSTTGKLIQNTSQVTIDDNGLITSTATTPVFLSNSAIQVAPTSINDRAAFQLQDVRAPTSAVYAAGIEVIYKRNSNYTGGYGGAIVATHAGTATGASGNTGLYTTVTTPGVGTDIWGANAGNVGLLTAVSSSSAGHNAGAFNVAYNSTLANYGSANYAYTGGTSATTDNIAVYGLASSYGSADSYVGGYFVLASTQYPVADPAPTTLQAALVADNGAVAANIAQFIDNGATTSSWILADGALSTHVTADNTTNETIKIAATQANVTGSDTFIDFRSSEGSEGSIAGTGVAGVIAYNTFTGSHWTKTRGSAQINQLLCAVDKKPLIPGKNQLFATEVCSKYQDKRVVGTYGGKTKEGYDSVLGIGTGYMIVKNTGVDVEVGDLLTTSMSPGLAEIQSDDLIHSYTAGKSTEGIKWKTSETERIISVIYLGG